MSIIEFPKALYKGAEYTEVRNKDEETAKRAEGWHDFGQAPAAKEADTEKADLLARAEALGIEVKGNWGIPKLKEVIAAKEAGAA